MRGDPADTAALAVTGLSRRFGATVALDAVSLAVGRGEFVAVIGGSGCGKTTLLRVIAGFTAPESGEVFLAGRRMGGLPPHRRGLGFVFQSYALFPTMDVAQNIGFALRLSGAGRAAIAARVAELCALVGLEGREARYPHELSGGQQQRVALARALAPRPAVMLLDEPLSAVDAQTRAVLREELRAILSRENATTLYVTHDQEEALTLADRIVVMAQGRVLQAGSPREVYGAPASAEVAAFLGRSNFLAGLAEPGGLRLADGTHLAASGTALAPGTRARAQFRPEQVRLAPGGAARVAALGFAGAVLRVRLALACGQAIEADLPATDPLAPTLATGEAVAWQVAPAHVRLFPAA